MTDGGGSVEPTLLHARVLDRPGVAHGFTTRLGGVSRPPFASLNLASGRGDDAAAVHANRERVRRAFGFRSLAFARQMHGRSVLTVSSAPAGSAVTVGDGDALITDTLGVGLVAQAADCVPVLVLDPMRPAVAAVHSGWRGVVADAAGAAVSALVDAFGSSPDGLVAAIGPAISKDRYRVGPEVLEAVAEVFGELDPGLVGPRDVEGGATFDVGEAVRRQLVRAGLRAGRVERLGYCTFDDARFFSSRRAGGSAFGGQAGVIGLTAPA